MLDEGFLDNSPELRLTFQKEDLRVIANAILDIRLQMLNMSDQEALDLMEKETFQSPRKLPRSYSVPSCLRRSCRLTSWDGAVGWRYASGTSRPKAPPSGWPIFTMRL